MKVDIYQEVTQRIIDQLEAGVAPWKCPYFCKGGMPRNYATKKEYRGINVFLLGCQRFTTPDFMTFIQAKTLGGHVRKGERGFLVVKYGTYSKAEETETGESAAAKTAGYLKAYTVFHISQIDGIDFPPSVQPAPLSLTQKAEQARQIVAAMPSPPSIQTGSVVPCYRPSTDSVHMPETGFFQTEEAYFSTLFHELAHSTGHASRLARKTLLENKGFAATGDTSRKTYAEEELVAEMASAFLNSQAGISEQEEANSAAYLQCWIDALKSKEAKTWIIRAASHAQKAADFILDRKEARMLAAR